MISLGAGGVAAAGELGELELPPLGWSWEVKTGGGTREEGENRGREWRFNKINVIPGPDSHSP